VRSVSFKLKLTSMPNVSSAHLWPSLQSEQLHASLQLDTV
jgi:hypothetical protein